MATDFLVEIILSGHDVFLLEDEKTVGNGSGDGKGPGNGDGWGFGAGPGHGDGSSDGRGFGWSSSDRAYGREEKKETYGYRTPS